jgi:hypothetical protein
MSPLRDLIYALILTFIAALIAVALPAHGAEPGLKAPSMAAIYVVKGKGYMLLNRLPCPAVVSEQITRYKDAKWFFGHEYHYKTKDFTRLCWTTLSRFDLSEGREPIEEPVAYIQYATGSDGVVELKKFVPYEKGMEAEASL